MVGFRLVLLREISVVLICDWLKVGLVVVLVVVVGVGLVLLYDVSDVVMVRVRFSGISLDNFI